MTKPGEWIEWSGGECPVAANTMIQPLVQYADRESPSALFARYAWAQIWNSPILIAYRIVDTPHD